MTDNYNKKALSKKLLIIRLLYEECIKNTNFHDKRAGLYAIEQLKKVAIADMYGLNVVNKQGFTAIHESILLDDHTLVVQLLRNSVLIKFDDLYDPLLLAIEARNVKIVRTLFEYGAILKKYTYSRSPIIKAIDASGQVLDIVLKNTSIHNLYELCIGDMLPIHYAIYIKNIHALKKLINFGCDINQRDSRGVTPLSLAVANEYIAAINILLRNGADIYQIVFYDGVQVTLKNVVMGSGHSELIKVFSNFSV